MRKTALIGHGMWRRAGLRDFQSIRAEIRSNSLWIDKNKVRGGYASFEIKITDAILKSKLRVLLFGFVVFLVFKLQMQSSLIL